MSKSITKPLNGIIDFTNKINSEKETVSIDELNSLSEGEDQVAHLVQAFKCFASNLINRTDEKVPKPLQISQKRIFPPNELYGQRSGMREIISKIKD